MDNLKDRFLNEYTSNIIQMDSLPHVITHIYEVFACLKKEPLKTVYILKNKEDGRKYLLKCLSPECKEDLASEYRLLSSLSHKGLPKAVQFFIQDGWRYFIREYFDGVTLADLVEKRDGLNVDESVDIIMKLCDILNYLHTQDPPVIHRDIKPQNIVYTDDGELKLIDLGISRHYRSGEAKDTVYMGTEATAPPEQFGYMQTDMRSDIYSIGVLMFYLITANFNVRKLYLYALPKPVKRMIARCTEFSPDDRYPTISQLQTGLKRFMRPPRVLHYACVCALTLIVCTGIAILGSRLIGDNPPKAEGNVVFSSPLIEKAVRVNLGKPDNETITYADLNSVTQILICGQTVYSHWDDYSTFSQGNYINNELINAKGDINSLDDILLMPNLKELALNNQQLTDITGIKSLDLKKLGLGSNSINDISSLSGCKGLLDLNLANNPISDISPLSKLPSLSSLEISNTKVKDITPLKGMSLDNLSMFETDVKDYDVLTALPQLRSLRVSHLSSQGLRTISRLTSLTDLSVWESSISSMDPFLNLTNLISLDLNSNDISEVSGVEKLAQLDYIALSNNALKDIAPLSKLENLKSINLIGSSVSDYTPLKSIPRLETIYCDTVMRKEIIDKLGEMNVKFVIQQ